MSKKINQLHADLHWAEEVLDFITPELIPSEIVRNISLKQTQGKIDYIKRLIVEHERREYEKTIR